MSEREPVEPPISLDAVNPLERDALRKDLTDPEENSPEDRRRENVRRFERLTQEQQELWNGLIDAKLDCNEGADSSQIEIVRNHLRDIAATLHDKFGRLDGDIPREAWTVFDGLLRNVIIKREDEVRQETRTRLLATAHPGHGAICIYPEFFRPRDASEPVADQSHIIGHEFGELAFDLFARSRLLEGYRQSKLVGQWARDGDYVNGEPDDNRFREEFAETFGDWLSGNSALELLRHRIARYDDRSEFHRMAQTEDGQKHLDYLLAESTNLNAFLSHAVHQLQPTLQHAINARRTADEEQAGLDAFDIGFDGGIPLFADAQGMGPRPPVGKSVLTRFWEIITGKNPQ